jgi:predicted anti-sigma-YlaC factor YlaD
MTDPLLDRLLGSADADPGCDATFELLDRYVDAVVRGDDVASQYAGVLVHLRNCPACREDAEGLLAAARELEHPAD